MPMPGNVNNLSAIPELTQQFNTPWDMSAMQHSSLVDEQ